MRAGNKSTIVTAVDSERWFSKSTQQGAPECREAAPYIIGGNKMIGWRMRGTQVAIAK
jgi:hypothetical protein